MTDQGSYQMPNKDDQAPASTATASTINRPWLIRIVVIVACLVGYAAWSLYDAFVAYPERGESYASWTEWQYLGHALEADSRESPGILRRDGAVADPVAELERLKSDEVQERNLQALQGGPRQRRAEMEVSRQLWLEALSTIGRLDPAYTNFYRNPDEAAAAELAALEPTTANAETISGLRSRLDPVAPRDRFQELNARWTNVAQPAPLRSYDIPVNKIQAVVCLAFAGYLLFLFVKVATKTYRWDPESKTLTLPSGESIAPADLEDVDKRKWDKFIVFLRVKDSHSQLAGKEIRFDTYRHGHIEDWILEMERVAFPDRAEEESEAAPEPQANPDGADGTEPGDEQARAV